MNRAAVSIPEKLFFKIGEVCDITGVQAHVLRYWESEFPMLAPQKNRAGQRTYRKRDVEMVLRIKELLYEDQYTIAGAKKKLVSELRGASKLKVVTPEMSASASQQSMMPAPVSDPLPSAPPSPIPSASVSTPASPRESFEEPSASEPASVLTEERRAAVRRLQNELRELLLLLEKGDAESGARRR
ncbi:MAG TPA: MerR family transcriptional regulator [Pyrinomonadaceae bacterium]|jgi:DNA-binding transcriptional MerR regulator